MPPFLHRCRYCNRLTFNGQASSTCKHCSSRRLETFRLVPHQPERISRRKLLIWLSALDLLIWLGALVLATAVLLFRV